MDFWGNIITKAVDKVLEGGAWAAFAILLLLLVVFLIKSLLRHGEGSTSALIRTAVALEALSLRIDGAFKPRGNQE